LVLEDIVNTTQRPKIDEYENYIFIVLKMLYYNKDENIVIEQVSFVLGENYVLTFQESEGDVFGSIRDRLRLNRGRIREMKSDYLLYALIDAVVDNYFTIIETLGNKIEDLETDLFTGTVREDINIEVQQLKREILKVRRAIFPLREIINRIEKGDYPFIFKRTITYFRDIYDHLVQVTENLDIYREMIWSLMDMYMTTISNKMNEVMKLLTIIATIFIPLTFIAGIYGMNFENIPELHYKYSYYILWGIMIMIFLGMIYYFKKKKWL
jgi:magnesium transporter